MDATTADDFALPVGDPARSAAGRAVVGSLALAAAFITVTWLTKELPALYLREPWQDDPYDMLVSFDLFVVPILLVAGGARVMLCRRGQPLPVRRAIDLLRVGQVLALIVAVTVASEWVSVALRTDRAQWTWLTALLAAMLVMLSAAAVVVVLMLRRAFRTVGRTPAPQRPDWLGDAVAFGELGASYLGPLARLARQVVEWSDTIVVRRVRRHPVRWALLAAVALSLLSDTPQVVLERYGPPLALFVYGISTASSFAFLLLAGTYLHVTERRASHAPPVVVAAVAGCAAAVLGAGFRASLWWMVGTTDAAAGLGDLVILTVLCGLVAAAVGGVVARARSGRIAPR